MWDLISYSRAAAAEARLDAMASCHSPSRMKMCDGMCWACGTLGAILAYLQIGFDVIFGGGSGRGKIGRDGFLPQSQPDENVRRHVLGMRDAGRDLGIPADRI